MKNLWISLVLSSIATPALAAELYSCEGAMQVKGVSAPIPTAGQIEFDSANQGSFTLISQQGGRSSGTFSAGKFQIQGRAGQADMAGTFSQNALHFELDGSTLGETKTAFMITLDCKLIQ